MKKTIVVLSCVLSTIAVVSGCIGEQLSEQEFKIIWQEYLTREFVESFDEEQSSQQRREILHNVLSDFNISQQAFYYYCQKKHPDKYLLFDIKPQ